MSKVAVVAHARKSFGGGLRELRTVLAREGVAEPFWYEVRKSRKAAQCARQAAAEGADLILIWGGDGTVQRCLDAVAGTGAVAAILPAGTANLLARNLEIPSHDVGAAVRVGLHGDRRVIDTGSVNGEHFAVTAGAGFDSRMIARADRKMKNRLGQAAYLYTGVRSLLARRVGAAVEVDGRPFFEGRVSCVLAGNVGRVLGGIDIFPAARPDDGLLELGVVTASNPLDWVRTMSRTVAGEAESSPFVEVTAGKSFRIHLDRKLPYQLDGGARPATTDLQIKAHSRSITICVPA